MLLEVRDLKTYFYTRYGVVKAVDGLDFSVNGGETLGIVGESGCGKTVTALSILQLVPQPGRIIAGKVIFEGEDLVGKNEEAMCEIRGARIGTILQDPMTSLNPVFTVGYQIAEPLKIHRIIHGTPRTERVLELLRLVRIPEPETRLRAYPFQLSGGMRQRAVGAIAIACEPHLLIADEPTTSLDVIVQAQYLSLLRQLQERLNLAIIFITHDFGIVARMCHRVAVMYAGRIVEIGKTTDIFDRAAHPYTGALLRSIPSAEERVERLSQVEGQPPDLGSLPPGCPFAPRCLRVVDRCTRDYPPTVLISEGHTASCWSPLDKRG